MPRRPSRAGADNAPNPAGESQRRPGESHPTPAIAAQIPIARHRRRSYDPPVGSSVSSATGARESALGGLDASVDPAQQVNPLGTQVNYSGTEIHGLGDLGTMISQLHQLKDAGGQVEAKFGAQGQVLDLRTNGSNARNEIFEVLRQHGVDPAGGGGIPKDPMTLQRDIMAALQRSGIDLNAYGMPTPPAGWQGQTPGTLPDGSRVPPIDPDIPDSGIRNPLH